MDKFVVKTPRSKKTAPLTHQATFLSLKQQKRLSNNQIWKKSHHQIQDMNAHPTKRSIKSKSKSHSCTKSRHSSQPLDISNSNEVIDLDVDSRSDSESESEDKMIDVDLDGNVAAETLCDQKMSPASWTSLSRSKSQNLHEDQHSNLRSKSGSASYSESEFKEKEVIDVDLDSDLELSQEDTDSNEAENKEDSDLSDLHPSTSSSSCSASYHRSAVARSKEMKQSTIHSLQGVVVIEDIKRLKSKLSIPNQSTTVLRESLRELGKKIPPRHVLLSTRIGQHVRRLKKHPNEEVSRIAKEVYVKWKTFFEDHRDRPMIEVKCDKKSESLRLRAKTFLSEALQIERDNPIVEALEAETFDQHKRRISPAYRRSMRNMVFKLKCMEELRKSVLNGDMTVESFVKRHRKR